MQPEPAPTRERMDVLFWTVFSAGTLLGLAPIWITDLLPVLDVASHLHLITIIHTFDIVPLYKHHYAEVNAIVPYISYYQLVDWLAWIGGVEWANKVVLSVSVGALPLAALHLIRRVGHDRWLVLGIFPWMLNADFFMGFFNYLMSIPLFLWILAEHVRFMQAPSWKRASYVAGLLIAMAITHYLLWGVTLVLLPALAFIFGTRTHWRKALWWPIREVGLVLPSIAVLLPWFLSYFVFADGVKTADQAAIQGETLAERLRSVYAGDHLTPLGNLKQIFDRMVDQFAPQPEHVRGLWDLLNNRPGEVVTSLWLIGAALWLMGALKGRSEDEEHPTSRYEPSLPSLKGTSYVGWALALVATAYFILPQHLNRPIILYGVNFRLVEVLGILSICALPTLPSMPRRRVRWRVHAGTMCLALAAAMMPIATAGMFLLARTEYGSVRDAMGSIPTGKRVLTLRYKRDSAYLRNGVFSNVGEYYAIFRHGYVPYSFADSSSKPVVARRPHTIPAPVWYDHGTFSKKNHARYVDYVAIFRGLDEKPGGWERSLRDWQVIYQRDRWLVLKNPDRLPWPPPSEEDIERRQRVADAVELALEWLRLDDDPDYAEHSGALFAQLLGDNVRLSPGEKRMVLTERKEAEEAQRAQAELERLAPTLGVDAALPPEAATVLQPAGEPATETDAPQTGDAGPPMPEATGAAMGVPGLKNLVPPPIALDIPPPELLKADPAAIRRALQVPQNPGNTAPERPVEEH